MKNRIKNYLLLMILPFLILSCSQNKESKPLEIKMTQYINEVSISTYAKMGGSAYFSLKKNGDAVGSHSSADKTPFIHEAKDILLKETVEVIFKQATKVLLQKLDENSIKKSNTSEIITITDSKGIKHCFSKNYEQSTINTELETLINLLKKHSIGW